jgi:hypothetical protein
VGDPAVLDPEVGAVPRGLEAIDDGPAPDHSVEVRHGSAPFFDVDVENVD